MNKTKQESAKVYLACWKVLKFTFSDMIDTSTWSPEQKTSQNPNDIPKEHDWKELASNILDFLNVFLFQLIPSLLFGILGLLFADASRLFHHASSCFRKETSLSSLPNRTNLNAIENAPNRTVSKSPANENFGRQESLSQVERICANFDSSESSKSDSMPRSHFHRPEVKAPLNDATESKEIRRANSFEATKNSTADPTALDNRRGHFSGLDRNMRDSKFSCIPSKERDLEGNTPGNWKISTKELEIHSRVDVSESTVLPDEKLLRTTSTPVASGFEKDKQEWNASRSITPLNPFTNKSKQGIDVSLSAPFALLQPSKIISSHGELKGEGLLGNSEQIYRSHLSNHSVQSAKSKLSDSNMVAESTSKPQFSKSEKTKDLKIKPVIRPVEHHSTSDGNSHRNQYIPMQSFVAAKVDAIEHSLLSSEFKSSGPLQSSDPDKNSQITKGSQFGTPTSKSSTEHDTLIFKLTSSISGRQRKGESYDENGNDTEDKINEVEEDDRRFEDHEIGDSLGRCSSQAVDVLQENFSDAEDHISSTTTGSTEGFPQAAISDSDDAPTGADCLQELIPEIIPDLQLTKACHPRKETKFGADTPDPPSILENDSPEIHIEDGTIVSVASMEQIEAIPSLLLPGSSSGMSIRTESYSSPDSSMHESSTDSMKQNRHRQSFQASDLALFSEDPMVDMEGGEKKKANRNGDRMVGAGFDRSVLGAYDGAKQVSGKVRVELNGISDGSVENEGIEITPVTSPTGRSSTLSRPEDLDSIQSWRFNAQRARPRSLAADGSLHRQASIDVTYLPSSQFSSRDRQTLKDRARPTNSRPISSHISPHSSISSVRGRPHPSSRVGRSVSSSEARFEDWPEYRPSPDEATRVSRRHQSDMSFSANLRAEILPPHMLHNDGPRVLEFPDSGQDLPQRFGGQRKGWKLTLGRTLSLREGNDRRNVMKNIFGRRRKTSNTENSFTLSGDPSIGGSYHRGSIDIPLRRSMSIEPDFTFDVELPLDTVSRLLSRICPECGLKIVVRRSSQKLKVEIPVEEGSSLLASITLTRLSNSRGTVVTLSRSRDDSSGAPGLIIKAAGAELQRSLNYHVEYIEDSFSSLQTAHSNAVRDDMEI